MVFSVVSELRVQPVLMLLSAQSGPERGQKRGFKAWLCIVLHYGVHSRVPRRVTPWRCTW